MSSQRKALSKKTRFEVFKRDAFTCQYCGAHPPSVVLHVDHITPVASGGKNNIENLVTSCEPCNLGKAARSLNEVPQSLKDKASAIKEQELQITGYQKVMQERLDRIESEKWRIADALIPGSSEHGMRKDWLQSIVMFIGRLGLYEVLDAATTANTRYGYSKSKAFPYFCGICWRKIKEAK